MQVNELKEELHKEIDALDDATALQLLHEAASAFAEVKRSDILDLLTQEQMERLQQSIEQANSGNTIPHAEVLQRIKQWRSK